MAVLFSALEGRDETAVHQLPREGEWSAIQTLAHVAEMMPFWARRAADIAQGYFDGCSYRRSPEELEQRNRVLSEQANDTLATMLNRLRACQRQATALLQSISAEAWDRTATWDAEQAPETVRQLVEDRIIGHLEAHAQQAAEATRARVKDPAAPAAADQPLRLERSRE